MPKVLDEVDLNSLNSPIANTEDLDGPNEAVFVKRRSSILKFGEKRSSRRVSWAQTFQYKELLNDGTTVVTSQELNKFGPELPLVKNVETENNVNKKSLSNNIALKEPADIEQSVVKIKNKFSHVHLPKVLSKIYNPNYDDKDYATVINTILNKFGIEVDENPGKNVAKLMELFKENPSQEDFIAFINHFNLNDIPIDLEKQCSNKHEKSNKSSYVSIESDEIDTTCKIRFNSTKISDDYSTLSIDQSPIKIDDEDSDKVKTILETTFMSISEQNVDKKSSKQEMVEKKDINDLSFEVDLPQKFLTPQQQKVLIITSLDMDLSSDISDTENFDKFLSQFDIESDNEKNGEGADPHCFLKNLQQQNIMSMDLDGEGADSHCFLKNLQQQNIMSMDLDGEEADPHCFLKNLQQQNIMSMDLDGEEDSNENLETNNLNNISMSLDLSDDETKNDSSLKDKSCSNNEQTNNEIQHQNSDCKIENPRHLNISTFNSLCFNKNTIPVLEQTTNQMFEQITFSATNNYTDPVERPSVSDLIENNGIGQLEKENKNNNDDDKDNNDDNIKLIDKNVSTQIKRSDITKFNRPKAISGVTVAQINNELAEFKPEQSTNFKPINLKPKTSLNYSTNKPFLQKLPANSRSSFRLSLCTMKTKTIADPLQNLSNEFDQTSNQMPSVFNITNNMGKSCGLTLRDKLLEKINQQEQKQRTENKMDETTFQVKENELSKISEQTKSVNEKSINENNSTNVEQMHELVAPIEPDSNLNISKTKSEEKEEKEESIMEKLEIKSITDHNSMETCSNNENCVKNDANNNEVKEELPSALQTELEISDIEESIELDKDISKDTSSERDRSISPIEKENVVSDTLRLYDEDEDEIIEIPKSCNDTTALDITADFTLWLNEIDNEDNYFRNTDYSIREQLTKPIDVLESSQMLPMFDFLKKMNFRKLNVRVQSISESSMVLRYLFSTLEVRIHFGSIIKPKFNNKDTKAREIVRIDLISLLDDKKPLTSNVFRGWEDKPMYNGDFFLWAFKEEHRPLLYLAHDYVLMHFEEKRTFFEKKYQDTNKLEDLINELSILVTPARNLATELRLLVLKRIVKILPKDSQGRFQMSVQLLGLRLGTVYHLHFSFDHLNYPDEVIHPTIIVPDKDKDLYHLEEFSVALKMIKPCTYNYISKLIKGAEYFIKALGKIMKHQRLQQKHNEEFRRMARFELQRS